MATTKATTKGVNYREGKFETRGIELHCVEYTPSDGASTAVLLFHHGLAEHAGRYKEVFSAFARAGIAVFSGDAEGHGRSPGERGYIHRFDNLMGDFLDYCTDVRRRQAQAAAQQGAPLPPFFIGGHSLGGLVAACACVRDQAPWAGLLVCSPALDLEWNLVRRVQVVLSGLLSCLAPRCLVLPAVKPEDMNPDPEAVARHFDDPLLIPGPFPARTGHECIKAMRQLRKQWPAFTLPLYAHHGDADKLTAASSTAAFVAAAGSSDKVFHSLPGGYHEVLLSPGKEAIIQEMENWILAHAAQAGTPPVAASKL